MVGHLLVSSFGVRILGSPRSSNCMEQGAAYNSGYILGIDGDRRMMYEMIRLGVWHSLYRCKLLNTKLRDREELNRRSNGELRKDINKILG